MALRGTTTTVKYTYICLAIALVLVLAISSDWVKDTKLVTEATTHQPERFTELYFSDSGNLPSAAQSEQILPVAFTVHNVEARNMTYAYSVEFSAPSEQSTVLGRQSFSLLKGETKSFTDDTKLPTFTGRAEISVILVGQPEAIHFWIVGSS